MKISEIKCRKCGSSVMEAYDRGAWLESMSKGLLDVECRPSCGDNNNGKEPLVKCLDHNEESK